MNDDRPPLLYPRDMVDALFSRRSIRPPVTEAEKSAWKKVIETVFFSSLYVEEGLPVRVSVVWMPGDANALSGVCDFDSTRDSGGIGEFAWDVLLFAVARPFTTNELRKLSKGLQNGHQYIVVAGSELKLSIAGVATLRPESDGGLMPLRLHSLGPGQLVFEDAFGETMSMDRGQLVEGGTKLHEIPAIRDRLEDIFNAPHGTKVYDPFLAAVPILVQRMRQRRSGALLALSSTAPTAAELNEDFYQLSDTEILKTKISSALNARLAFRKTIIANESESIRTHAREAWHRALTDFRRAFDLVGHLSAIDGAVLAGPQLAIFGAGFIIGSGLEPRLRIVERRPRAADRPRERVGARHDAACRFVETHPDGLAFVVSADGPVSCALNTGKAVELWRGWMPQLEERLLIDRYDHSSF